MKIRGYFVNGIVKKTVFLGKMTFLKWNIDIQKKNGVISRFF